MAGPVVEELNEELLSEQCEIPSELPTFVPIARQRSVVSPLSSLALSLNSLNLIKYDTCVHVALADIVLCKTKS